MSHEFMTDEERIELQKNNPLHGLKLKKTCCSSLLTITVGKSSTQQCV